MMFYKRLLIAASFGLALPVVSFADVFSCPSYPLITMTEFRQDRSSSVKYLRARLENLPDGMPAVFKGARFISDGFNDPFELGTDISVNIHFVGAIYDDGSILKYECIYEAREEYSGIPVTLRLSENYLPESNKVPLLVKPYGPEWQKPDAKGSLMECAGTVEECSFELRQFAVRTKTSVFGKSKAPAPKAYSLNLHTIREVNEKEVLGESHEDILATNEFKYIFSSGSPFKSGNSTNIELYGQNTSGNIYDVIKDRGWESRAFGADDGCAFNSGVTVKCSCSQENLISSLSSNGYTMVDLNASYDETYSVTAAQCSLFNIPASAKED